MDALNNQLEDYVVEKLEEGNYKAVEAKLTSAGTEAVTNSFFGLHSQLFRHYVKVAEECCLENEDLLRFLLKYIAQRADVNSRFVSSFLEFPF